MILHPCPKCGKVNTKLVPDHERQCRVANNRERMANGMANSTTYRYRDADKRRTYMRELMRKRRALGAGLVHRS
jgi:hypothetical protein